MTVREVYLSADAFLVCLTHALSTEKEEIMGLLIGDVSHELTSHISAVILLRRSCKQADRVEISPEQLSAASTQAEVYSTKCKRPMRVIGWYHSHPHITVWPSHIDVRTQADYQSMDDNFIGLIFSVFNHEKTTNKNSVQVSCFRSVKSASSFSSDQWERQEVELHIVPADDGVGLSDVCMEALTSLPHILCEEEQEAYQRTRRVVDLDLLTRVHNSAVYTSGMVQINESMYRPILETLEWTQRNANSRLEELKAERKRLEAAIKLQKNNIKSSCV